MFFYATEKLQDARISLDRLRIMTCPLHESNIKFVSGPEGDCGDNIGIVDPIAFSEAFSSCIIQIRAVGEAILNVEKLEINGIKVNERELNEKNQFELFMRWKKEKLKYHKELEVGELINFIYEERIADFHFGVSRLAFTMYGHSFSTTKLGEKPTADATWIINGKGLFWLVNKGTSKESFIPCDIKDGYAFGAKLINPPRLHQNQPLSSTDPLSICVTALNYYEELLFEAKSKFGD